MSQETANLSRIPTMILIIGFTVIPFFFDAVWLLVLLPVYLGIFEDVVHTAGIKIFRLRKPYTSGLVPVALADRDASIIPDVANRA